MKTANLTPETKALYTAFKAGEIDEQTLDDTIEGLAIVPPKSQAMEVFTTPNGLDPYLLNVRNEVDIFLANPPSIETEKGRKAYKSMAFKVSRFKSTIDAIGKDLVDELKDVPKKVDAERKKMRDYLDCLRDEVKAPVDAWEAEQARIEAEAKAKAEHEALLAQIEADHEVALLYNEKFDRDRAEALRIAEAARIEAERVAEQQRIEREQRIAAEAAAKAKRDAEEAARIEREAAERKVLEAKLAQERAERENIEAEQRAKHFAEHAEKQRLIAIENAELDKKLAIEQERKRQQDEAARIARENEEREADFEHRAMINREAYEDILKAANISEAHAKQILVAIVNYKVRHIKVNY